MASSQVQLSTVSRSARGSGSTDGTTVINNSLKLKEVVDILSSLRETDGFQGLTQLINEGEVQRTELGSRANRIAQLEKEKKEEQEQHDIAFETLEVSHQRSQSKLIADKERLNKQISALRDSVKRQADDKAKLKDQGARWEAELVNLKEGLRSSEDTCKRHLQKANESEIRFQKAKSETEQLRGELQRGRDDLVELNKAKTTLEKTHQAILQKHDSTKAELAGLQKLTVRLNTEDLATTTQRMDSIWKAASSIVMKHFQAKLAPACLDDPELWKNLKSPPGGMSHAVPLPRSDTPAARDMRSAVVLAYLFHMIDDEVFQPNYAMHEDLDGRAKLLQQAVKNSDDESLYRSFLLSVYPDVQKQIVQERAHRIVGAVTYLVQGMLSESQMADFRADLHGLLNFVCAAWQKIQRLSTRFEPHMECVEDPDFEWQPLQLESGDTVSKGGPSERVELVVFPRLYMVQDDEPRPVTSGVVLRYSQTLAAAQELRKESASSPMFGRSYSSRIRPRRDSVQASDALSRREGSAFLYQGTAGGRSNGEETS